jgi:hypothetical protein
MSISTSTRRPSSSATLDPINLMTKRRSAMAGRDDEKLRSLLAEITVDDAGLLALLGDLAGIDGEAPPGECAVKGRGYDDGAARVDPGSAAARAAGRW